jgi:hypothetical protein
LLCQCLKYRHCHCHIPQCRKSYDKNFFQQTTIKKSSN